VLIYTACVSGLGIVLLLWSLSQLSSFPRGVLLLVGLVVIAELTTTASLRPQILFSMSSAVCFATLLLFGPLPSALTAIAGGLAVTLVQEIIDRCQNRSRIGSALLQRALFNMAALGLAFFIAGEIYVVTSGTVGKVALFNNLLPMVLAVASTEIVNAALVVGVVSLQTGESAFQIWKQNVSWAAPMNLLVMIVGGGGLALGYQIAGPLGLGVFSLPVVLPIYAYRLYVAQTKAQMTRLEEIIVERTDDLRKAKDELELRVEERTVELTKANEALQQEITERVQAEEQIQAALREKEVLLKEIHHRVKNNLQVMCSLLYLQSKNIEDEKTLELLQDGENRVRSMALVHERLYHSEDLARVDFTEYVRSLTGYLFRSYGVHRGVIQLRLDANDIYLGVDTAVPCGLMVNELVSNCLKHAFPGGRGGEIRIKLRSDDDTFTLTVSDNGVGFPEGLDFQNTESLGLRLINTLAGQLEGTIELDRSNGTAFEITFAELN
jgi:two-component sensor histidine kinase